MAKRRRAHLFGIGETKRRHHRRSSGSKGWSGVDTVMTIAALGAVGFVGYFVLKSGKGIEEGLQTGGDWLKSFTDAVNSTGYWIGSSSKGAQDWSYNVQKGVGDWIAGVEKARQDALESTMNAGCWSQKSLAGLFGGIFGKGPECTDLNAKNHFLRIGVGGTKPVPKLTNNVYNMAIAMGADPNRI